MAITVEDGSNVAGANSYVDLADARTLLQALGQDLDVVDATAEQQILNAARYVEAFRARYQGWKTTNGQPMQWPRSGVVIDDEYIDSDTIPQDLIDAQIFAAYEYAQGQTLQPSSPGQSVQSEEVVGAVKVSYFDTGVIDGSPTLVRVNDSLNPLFESGGATMRGMRG